MILRLWPRIAAAASVIVCLGMGGYFIAHRQAAQTRDIAPGGNKAVLTLADGRQIVLTGAGNGRIAGQGNSLINKTADGHITYAADKGLPAGNIIVYNTITVPRKGQYQLTLADGSNVWLNAESSIRYPASFTGNDREVEITGEAYFEVVHNAARPFRVRAGGELITDLGTHFNINAYTNEPAIRTTLLQGSVSVTKDRERVLLAPGQQAEWSNNKLSVVPVAADEETAWKDGNFRFDNADIRTVMRQLVRWYDVAVKYDDGVPAVHYSGLVPRKSNISAVLQMLKETGNTNFKISGNTVIITH